MSEVEDSSRRTVRVKEPDHTIPGLDNYFFFDQAGAILLMVISIGIQRHIDRLLSAQLIQSEGKLQTSGARIADIQGP